MPSPILVTGAAGFIGFHVARRLLADGHAVVGVDDLNAYYDPALKEARVAELRADPGFLFEKLDLADRAASERLFAGHAFGTVIHLAAQAGVRYSLTNPHAYVQSNVVGFLNVLEGCRHRQVGHLVFASTSSVYGANTRTPFSVSDSVDHPISLYAATKKADELMAHTYSHLYGLPTTGLRFFTVYGPWGRPDMAVWIFTRAILAGEPIRLFNDGRMRRDFTYIDDIVEGVVRIAARPAQPDPAWNGERPDPATSRAPYRLYNIGNNRPTEVLRLVEVLEQATGRRAIRELAPMQPGDVVETCADVDALAKAVDFAPSTPIEAGVPRFVEWFRAYHRSRAPA